MVTRKNVLAHVGKKFKSIGNASPAKVAQYAGRAATNVGAGGFALATAANKLKSGDIQGAAKAGHMAANKVIGKKNITAAGHVVLGKKGSEKVTKGVKTINRADKAYSQYQSGDIEGAAKTAMGKKMYDKSQAAPDPDSKMSHHIARAKHHSEQAQAVHSILSGKTPEDHAIGGGGMKPR
jgi:hypothetical protein